MGMSKVIRLAVFIVSVGAVVYILREDSVNNLWALLPGAVAASPLLHVLGIVGHGDGDTSTPVVDDMEEEEE